MTSIQIYNNTVSLAFAATWRRYCALRPAAHSTTSTITYMLMGEFDGRGLVQANTVIDVGDYVSLESINPQLPSEFKVVAAIDKDSRASTGEWLLSWAKVPTQRDDARNRAVTLDPERFADIMLDWVHTRTATTGQAFVDLTDFARGDIPLDCLIPLADHLCSIQLMQRGPGFTLVSLTAAGVAAVTTAAIERNDRTKRTEFLQNGIVLWIWERSDSEDPVDLRHFLHDSRAVFRGRFFTESELNKEFAYLGEMGLVHQDSPWWHWPSLTATGRDCAAYHGGNVHESTNPTPAPTGNTILTTGSHNQIAIGAAEQHSSVPPQPAPEAATQKSRFLAFATSTAGVITWVCTVVVAVFTVLIYFATIK